MAYGVLPVGWGTDRQLRGPIPIAWNNPITNGLAYADLLSEARTSSGPRLSNAVGTKLIATPTGVMRGFGSAGQGATDSYETTLNTNVTKRTFFIRSRADGSGGLPRIFDKRTVSAQSDVLLLGGLEIQYSTNFSGGERQVFWPQPALGRTVFIALVTDYVNPNGFGDHVQLFYDGVKQSTTRTANGAGSYLATADNYVIGNRTNDFARVFNGLLSDFLVWDRALSDAEIASISANPWQLFRDDTSDALIFDMGAGGGAYTISADPGSYLQTGQAAQLTIARLLSADSGSYTLAGQQAELLAAKKLVADSGSYAVTGQDATIQYSAAAPVIDASPGSFTVGGQDAALVASRPIVAQAGSLTVTGQAATFAVNRLLSADAGNFAVTGQTAEIIYAGSAPTLIADAGTHAVTGQAAELLTARVLIADAGSYNISGMDVSFGAELPLTTAELRDMYESVMYLRAQGLTVPKFLALK